MLSIFAIHKEHATYFYRFYTMESFSLLFMLQNMNVQIHFVCNVQSQHLDKAYILNRVNCINVKVTEFNRKKSSASKLISLIK